MKKTINHLIVTIAALTVAVSCDFLDVSQQITGGLTDFDQVFNNVDYTKRWYSDIFRNVPDYSHYWVQDSPMGNPWAAQCDEIYHREMSKAGKYSNWNSSNTNSARWTTLYQSIRECNIFLERVHEIVSETGASANKLTAADIIRYKANVRFMRAVYHYYLFELYGPIPIVDHSFTLEDDLNVPRSSVDEVVDWIDSEIMASIPDMEQEPYHNNDSYKAVPTKGVALAVRAKLHMYAASPLLNGGFAEAVALRDKSGKQLFPSADAGKWTTAVNAMKDFIDYAEENDRYYLYEVPGDAAASVYGCTIQYSPEVIWCTSQNNFGSLTGNKFVTFATPRSEYRGQGGLHLLQELVDDFYMADGLPIKATSFLPASPAYSEEGLGVLDGFQVSKMYIGREPRFYNAVTFSGKKWQVTGNEVQFYLGGNSDKTVADGAPVTGYLVYKRYHHDICQNVPSSYVPSIIFRLAEFYLLYAEAVNEVNPADPRVLKYLNLVRNRAGLPNLETLNPAVVGDKDMLRAAIQRESRIELCTEGQRYFDVRRWMICENPVGEGGQGGDFSGMNIDAPKAGYHVRKKSHTRSFKRKNYLYPIPLNEIRRSSILVQNPGW